MKFLAQLAGIFALALLLSHWLVGGQQEIVDRKYDPNRCVLVDHVCQ